MNPINFQSTFGDGAKLATYSHPLPDSRRKAVICYVHGYGSNTAKYAFLAQAFAHYGYEFCGIDQRGFGNSEGTPGRIESISNILNDVHAFNV